MPSRTGIFGGAFDPPHNGHVALVRAAKAALGLDRVIVVVAAAPGHKHVGTPAAIRLAMAEAAFPDDEVIADDHARTVDMLRAHPEWTGAVFLLGADEYAAFPEWKEPEEILRRVTLGVAARPGHPVEQAEGVRFFELDRPEASTSVRGLVETGGRPGEPVPPAVAAIIERDGLYRRRPGYTELA